MRLRQIFWLDVNKPDEQELAEYVGDLKEQRSFVSTIRDGLRLVRDLRAGRTDVLRELFPWVFESTGSSNGGGGDDELRQDVRQLKQLILQQRLNPPPDTHMKPLQEGAYMTDDLEDIVITKDKDAGKRANENFLRSMYALNPQVAPKQTPARAIVSSGSAKPLAGADVPLSAPADVDIDW